ncbi:hypothetical protein [Afifella sp. YEN Y35]|uniref:hypothetical protein n=1 Tax=Afifella sp. YEN Y35 TaxID=3388337 RepID=UPI0039E15E4A
MLKLEWRNKKSFDRFADAVEVLGEKKGAGVKRRALNRAGDQARTAAGRELAGQTGLKKAYTGKKLRDGTTRAKAGRLLYTIKVQGGDVPLKYFDAKETRKGVSAKPFGKRQVFEHSFIKGGLFPRRKVLNMGGHVFEAATDIGAWGRPFEKKKSGVVLPTELVKGATAAAWEKVGTRVLQERIAHEIKRATGGVVS